MVTEADILAARILIVDDQELNIDLLRRMLRSAGYSSVSAITDPRQACELHRQNSYGLILLDLQMPGMDGFEVMEALKEIETDSYLPVLVITAQPDHKIRALKAGAKDFVSKPFDSSELRARVHNILQVRLLHLELKQTVRELEESREVIRLKNLAEKEKMEQELAQAEETQRSLLPVTLPDFRNYRIRAWNSPTRYVGGDFYDFLELEAGHWMGALADVSGKGIPAALLSSLALGALRMAFQASTEPGEVVKRVNQLLCEKSLEWQFVTLFLFVLDAAGTGQFVSAGHNLSVVYRAASGKTEELRGEDYFLGMFDFATYTARPLSLDPGDILFVYSDGLSDARNEADETFGNRRVMQAVRENAALGGAAIERSLLEEIGRFTGNMPQTDDITFVAVERVIPIT